MIFILVFIQLILVKYSTSLSEDKIKEILREKPRQVIQETDPLLIARAGWKPKKTLPSSGDIFSGLSVDKLKCGDTYYIKHHGYIYFKLNSAGKQCYHEFIGSKSDTCTAGIICKGGKDECITLGKVGQDKGCTDNEKLTITDGTEGSMTGCGNFSFKEIPRTAKNGGTNLYVTYMGSSSGTCLVLCVEEIKGQSGIKEACGKRKDFGRIVGGTTAMKYEFPWLGAVVFKGPGYGRQPFCGGALINNHYFLSAAHCFVTYNIKASDIEVVLNAHVMDKIINEKYPNANDPVYQKVPGWDLPPETDQSENSIRLEVSEIRSHRHFSIYTGDFDIAILQLKTPVDLTDGRVSTICLPEVKEQLNYKDGDSFFIAGWGDPFEKAPAPARVLQKLDVPYLNRESCRKYTIPSHRHFCAGYVEGGKDSCQGDSGGPIIRQFNREANQYMLSGIMSAGEGCARKNKVGLYTSVPELIQWIYHHTSNGTTWCQK